MSTSRSSTRRFISPFKKPPGLPTFLREPLLPPPQPATVHIPTPLMPPLDLNAQPNPLDQRYVLLPDDAKEVEAPSNIKLTPEEQEHLAHHILRDLTDNLKSLSGLEYLVIVPAIAFALAACSTSKDFGDKFVEGMKSLFAGFNATDETTQTEVAWGIAAANFCAQFSLSTNSVITVLTRLLRSCQRAADAIYHPDLKAANATANKYDKPLTSREKAYLAAVPLSAAATFKMGYDTLTTKYNLAPGVGYGIGALRYGSAAAINFSFLFDQIYRWRGDNDNLPLIILLKAAKNRLINLANDAQHPLEFIKALHQNNLLKQLNGINTNPAEYHTHKKQVEALVDELLKSTPFIEAMGAAGNTSRCTKADIIQWVSMILGGLVSLTNFKAGTRVPELFGLTVAKDLVDFVSNLATDWSLGIAALGLLFGVPSWFSNLIINARSCMNFANGIGDLVSDISKNGIKAVANKYWSADGALVAALFVTSVGYGAGNGGAGFKYPPLNMVPIPIINLLLSSAVFTALGNLSQQGAVAKLRDKKDDHLLQDAINTNDLEGWYKGLTASQQNTLLRLLVSNVTLALNSKIASCNKLQDDAVNGMFTAELQKNLESRYGSDLTEIVTQIPVPPVAATPADLTSIVIDPMLTRAQTSALTGIHVDPMTMPTAALPPATGLIHARPPGAHTGSPVFSGSTASPTLFYSGSPSAAAPVTRHSTRHHSSILGSDTRTALDPVGPNLMPPTKSPTVSPSVQPRSPYTPHHYPVTPLVPSEATAAVQTQRYGRSL